MATRYYTPSVGKTAIVNEEMYTQNPIYAGVVNRNLQSEPKTEISSLSTKSGKETLTDLKSKLNAYSPVTTPTTETPTPAKVPVATFTNTSGQEAVYTQDQLNDVNVQNQLKSGGYVMSKTEGPTQLAGEKTVAEQQIENLANQISTYNVDQDPAYAAKATEIKNKYAKLKEEMKQTNYQRAQSLQTLGFRYGTTQYGGGVQTGIESSELTQANQRLSDINSQEQSELANAKEAIRTGKYTEMYKAMDAFEKVRTMKKEALDEYNKAIGDKLKAVQEANAEAQKKVNEILIEAGKNGAPKDVLDAINNSTDLAEAITMASDYMQSGTGTIGEYIFYKRDAEARGITPVDFNTYQNQDANRKISIANASAGSSGLNSKQVTIFNGIVDKYNKSPLVLANDRAIVLRTISDKLKSDPTNASLQLSFIYSMVQALDTYQSAVREGEIGMLQSTQGLADKIKNYPAQIEKGSLLSTKVINNYINTAKILTDSIQSAADKKASTFSSQAKIAGVGDAFGEYVNSVKSSNTTGNDLIANGEQAKNSVINSVKANPQLKEKVRGWLAQGLSYEELLQVYPEYFK